jgi:glutamate formiminotransferase
MVEDMGRRSRQIAVEKYDVNAVNADIIGHVRLSMLVDVLAWQADNRPQFTVGTSRKC